MPKTPALTVVVPCFNDGRYLHEAIESVLGQHEELEILVVDDGSTDDSVQIASSYGEPVRVIRHGRNRGVAAALNTGFEEASSDLVMILAADDLLAPGSIVALTRAAHASPEVEVFIPKVDIVAMDTGDLIHEIRYSTLDLHRILAHDIPQTCGIVFRSSLLTAHPYRPVTDGTWVAGCSEDLQFWLEVAAAGVRAISVPGARGLYRARADSLSKDASRKWRAGKVLLADPAFRHPGCAECDSAAKQGRAALRDYCFTLDLAQVFGRGRRRGVVAVRAVRRDPVVAPRLVWAAAWRTRDRLLCR